MTFRFTNGAAVAIMAGALAGCAMNGSSPQQPVGQSPAAGARTLNTDSYPLGAYGSRGSKISLRGSGVVRGNGAHYAVKKSSKLAYVSNAGGGAVEVFDQKGKNQQPIATITDGILGPGGLTTDRKGNLYVSDEGPISGKWTVQVYAPGTTSPAKSYTTDLSSPTDAVVAADGTIYIANFNGFSNGWVTVYPKGNVKKEYRLSDFQAGAPLSVALDKQQNLYVMYDYDSSDSAVNEYAPGAKTGTNLNLVFGSGGGIQVDPSGNIIIAQQLDPSEFLVFAPGKTQPSKEIPTPSGGEPFNFALNYKAKLFFGAEWFSVNQVDRFTYPAFKFQYILANGFNNPSGVAAAPYEF